MSKLSYCNHEAMHHAFDMREALRERGLGGTEYLILMVIASHINRTTHDCFLSFEGMSTETLLSRSTVARALKALKKAGTLRVSGLHHSGAYHYKIAFDQCQNDTPPSVNLTPPQCQNDMPPSVNLTPEVVTGSSNGIVKGNSHLQVSPGPGEEDESCPLDLSEKAKAKTTATTTATAKTQQGNLDTIAPAETPNGCTMAGRPAPPPPPATVPTSSADAQRLAALLLQERGNLLTDQTPSARQWPTMLDGLLRTLTAVDLNDSIVWGSNDDHWGRRIRNYDPMVHFAKYADALVQQYKAAKPQPAAPVAEPADAKKKLTHIEERVLYWQTLNGDIF